MNIMGNIEDIDSVLKKVISELKLSDKINKAKLFNHWEDIIGEEISKKAKPKRLKKGLLYVSVTTSTWANELNLMSGQIIRKINSYIGEDIVKEIRFSANL